VTGRLTPGEASLGPLVRRAYKPNADVRSHRRVGSTRYESPREMAHLVTGGPTTNPLLAKGGFTSVSGESQSRGRPPGNGGRGRAPRGVRPPASLARGWIGRRFQRLRLRGPAARTLLGGNGQPRAGSRGVPPDGGTGKTLGRRDRNKARRPGRWLAHASAHEALAELGRRPTVVRGVLKTLRIDGSWARESRRRCPGRGELPRLLDARRCTRYRACPCRVYRRD